MLLKILAYGSLHNFGTSSTTDDGALASENTDDLTDDGSEDQVDKPSDGKGDV